jgi:hypothetical protein
LSEPSGRKYQPLFKVEAWGAICGSCQGEWIPLGQTLKHAKVAKAPEVPGACTFCTYTRKVTLRRIQAWGAQCCRCKSEWLPEGQKVNDARVDVPPKKPKVCKVCKNNRWDRPRMWNRLDLRGTGDHP